MGQVTEPTLHNVGMLLGFEIRDGKFLVRDLDDNRYSINGNAINGASQVVLAVKTLPADAGGIRDMGSIPGSRGSPGGGHGSPLHILAWRIPWAEEPGGLQSIESQRV